MLNFENCVKNELLGLLVNFLICAVIGVFIYQGYTMFNDTLNLNAIRIHNLTHRLQNVEDDINRNDSDSESDHSEKEVKSL